VDANLVEAPVLATRPESEPAPAEAVDPALVALADELFEGEAQAAREAPPRRPASTYRLQLHAGYRLDQVEAAVPYLHDLGITDLYLSPHLVARPGSTHGYDVFDHGRLNAEIGTDADYDRLNAALAARGMGRVLDIVPNHMGIGGINRFWNEVLESGPQAPSARFFDIDWHPVKEELAERVLLPILEDQYGVVLERGLLRLERDGGAFFIRYHDHRFPVAPRSYGFILGQRPEELERRFDRGDPDVMEYRSIRDAADGLPDRLEDEPAKVERKLREKEVIKRRIERLCREDPALCEFLDENVALFAGEPGDPRSFDLLHQLLEGQVYRLAYWRVAAEEINYRRFFDINDLAGLRTEDPAVFDVVHELIFRWVAGGGVTGLRVDHPDGLADPPGYFRRLQESLLLIACRRRFEERGGREEDWPAVSERIRRRYREAAVADPASPLARRFPIVAEKILSKGEDLPDDWPIDGTVGYEYLNALNGLFIDPTAAEAIDAAYAEFTGDREPFPEVVYNAKRLITRASMSSEVNMLARRLNRVSEHDRRSRDFTLNNLRVGLREVVSCFPIYRTYIRPGAPIAPRDRGYVEQAVARARRRNPDIDASLFAFLQQSLLLELPEGLDPADLREHQLFVLKFQQTTGPVQAKGLEDTAFYRQVKLASLNEVGGDPGRFGTSPSTFHALNAQRLARWPGALGTTATHDTKRGEDTRVRIDALSEFADEFRTRLARWSRWNARKKVEHNDQPAPDTREEYLLYQTLLGAWPLDAPEEGIPEGFVERVQQYMLKAAREAKVNTTWTDPDPTYAEILSRFVAEILESPDAGPFLNDFLPFQRRLARVGVVHSLAQAVLKVASPGVPDIYQGCELWDFSLVDPDNRRPVDYDRRREILASIRSRLDDGESRRDLAASLLAAPEDGAIKLYLLWTALNHRRANPSLYELGSYRPIDADGERKTNTVAFGRYREGRSILVAAPRLAGGLMGEDARTAPLGPGAWSDTHLLLPEGSGTPRRWRNLFTGEGLDAEDRDGRAVLPLARVFDALPVALLEAEAS
jgi:(1->4)-alpha-D-glucan 1-alpha-D-glucosylmutase